MKSPLSPVLHNRRRSAAIFSAALVLILLVGVGVYGLLAGPRAPDDASPTPAQSDIPATSPAFPPPRSAELPTIPDTEDPESFARATAEVIFMWDTASGFEPLDYMSVTLDAADPSGTEQAGLAADLTGYLPSRDAWRELRHYGTRQSLTIDEIQVPKSWETAVEQARPGQLASGTVAYTIDGTRHRTGIWNGEVVFIDTPVVFTVFIVCAPTYTTCHLLRLSALDNPLP